MDILLNNLDWKIKAFWPWIPLKETSMETGQKLMGVTDWIPAMVPGGVHYDLYKAGLIEHPYKDLNSLKHENIYIFSTREETLYKGALELEPGTLKAYPVNDWQRTGTDNWSYNSMLSRTYEVSNTGTQVMLFVHPEEKSDGYWMMANHSFFVLFPREKKNITISCTEKKRSGFLEEFVADSEIKGPEIEFKFFMKQV